MYDCYPQPSGVMVNNISLSVENVVAANGIIHIIDTAIMPPSEELVVGDRSVRTGYLSSMVVRLASFV